MQHTLLVIGAAIDRAAKATAVKNVDFMLIDLSDEAEKGVLMLLYVFKRDEKKKQHPPHSSYAKTTSCLQRGHERRFLASFRWHVHVLPLCSFSSRHAHQSSNIGGHCHGSTKVR